MYHINLDQYLVIDLWKEGEKKTEYRAWNPFRSKLAAAILGGVDKIYMKPGSKVLYLGAASGTTVSHVSDIVGPVSTNTYWRLYLIPISSVNNVWKKIMCSLSVFLSFSLYTKKKLRMMYMKVFWCQCLCVNIFFLSIIFT